MIEKVVAAAFILNVVLSSVSSALHALAARYTSLNGADSVVAKLAAVLAKIVDFASANVAHKAVEAPKAE